MSKRQRRRHPRPAPGAPRWLWADRARTCDACGQEIERGGHSFVFPMSGAVLCYQCGHVAQEAVAEEGTFAAMLAPPALRWGPGAVAG